MVGEGRWKVGWNGCGKEEGRVERGGGRRKVKWGIKWGGGLRRIRLHGLLKQMSWFRIPPISPTVKSDERLLCNMCSKPF